MGEVYLARHVTLGRPAAIKVLHASLSSNQDMVTRFFNEARAATAVRNPGIVEVFDFGILEDRSAYIVMEYLEGENLGARIRRGRLPLAATMTIVRAISRALQAAHEQGIVHRDLKPDNVFLVPDPELPSGERVKLLDFGIAKLAPVSGEASQTRTGMVMGTPTYMAPEQCRGAGSVDHRADLYALGCVAYHMLCGQPPFVADGAGDLIARHLYFQPQPLRSLAAEIPADVDDLVLWLLQKDPAARPASAADLVRAIDHLAAASVAGVMQTHPPTRFSASNFAPVADTTLRGAAASVALTGATVAPAPRRTPIIAGLAVGVIAVAAMLFVVLRGHGEEAAPTPAAAPVLADRGQAPPAAALVVTPPVPPPVAPAPVAPAVPAPPPAAEPPDRSERTDRKKHAPSRSRGAGRDPEPASARTAEPDPTPAHAPSPPVARPPVTEPSPAEPVHAALKPPAVAGAALASPKAPPLVSSTAVSKVSGVIPAIKVKGLASDFVDVVVKLCITELGAVSSVKIVKAPQEIAGELSRGLQSWHYTPYVNAAGAPSAACFPVAFRVVLKS